MRFIVLAAAVSLAGCATYSESVTGNPEVLYRSARTPGLQIVRTSTAHRYTAFTPDGTRSFTKSYEHRHAIVNPDRSTTSLAFLDTRNAPPDGTGVYSAILELDANGTWIALRERFDQPSLDYSPDGGWHSSGGWQTAPTVKVFLKSFTRKAQLNETALEVCNPQNPANPPIVVDAAIAAVRYVDGESAKLYFPLTGETRVEGPGACRPWGDTPKPRKNTAFYRRADRG